MTSFFVTLILYFGINYWRHSAALESDTSAFVTRLNTQDYIRETVGTSSGLIIQNSIPDANALKTDPINGAEFWEPIHATPQTIAIGGINDVIPLLYFRRISLNTDGTVAMNGTQPHEDQYILYINGATKQLLSRSLANPDVATNKLKTSCPPDIATDSCPADKVIMENLDSIETNFYSRSGNSIDYYSIIDPETTLPIGPDYPSVEAVQFTLNIRAKSLFQKSDSTINSTVVRIALRNL